MKEDSRLFGLIPPIRRARGYRVYDGAGRRYLDLYQGGGAAILGHRSQGTVREMKEALSRGLAARLPSDLQIRLEKALLRMFPDYRAVRIYSCLPDALEAASAVLGSRLTPSDIRDPAFGDQKPAEHAAYWRPFLPPGAAPRLLIPILPVGWDAGVVPLLCQPHDAPDRPRTASPVGIAGTLRALADLPKAGSFDGRLLSSLRRACGWRLTGPYLRFLGSGSEYGDAFRSFLRAGVLLSPEYPGPSILPQEISEGELHLLNTLLCADTGR